MGAPRRAHSAGGELCSPPHHSSKPTALPKNTSPQPPGRAELHSAGGELCSPPHHSTKPPALPKNTSPQPPGSAWRLARRVLGAPSCTRQEASFARLPTTPPYHQHSPKTLHRSPLGARGVPARRVLGAPSCTRQEASFARLPTTPPNQHHSPKTPHRSPLVARGVPARRVLGAPSCTRQEASFARLPTTPPNQHHSPKTPHRSPLGARASPPAVYWARRVALGRRRALLASPPLHQATSTPQKHLTAAPWERGRLARRVLGAPSCTRQEASFARLPTTPPYHHHSPKTPHRSPLGARGVPARRVLGAPSCTRQEASFARLPTTPPNQHHSPKTLHRSPLGARASPPAVYWARRVALGRRRALLASPPLHQATSTPQKHLTAAPWARERPRPPCTGCAELHSAGGELCSPPHHSTQPTSLPKNTSPQSPGRASVPARRVLGAPSCTRQEASFARLPTTPPSHQHSPKTPHRSPLGARASPPAVCWARRVALGRRRALLASPPLQQANSTPQKHFTAVPWARERPRPPCTGRAELHSAGGELCSPPHHSTKPPALPKNTSPQPPGRASVPARRVLGAPSCTRQEASFARLPTTPPNQHHSPKTLHRSPLGARASPPAVYWVRRVALGRRRALLASPPLQQANSTPQKHLTAAPWARGALGARPSRPPCKKFLRPSIRQFTPTSIATQTLAAHPATI